MKLQGQNPYLPGYEYIPDAEPHIVGDRVYIYGSHDKFNGLTFCMNDYICYSAPIDDLGNWSYEGVIFRKEQDPSAKPGRVLHGMAAPDMLVGPDGRFYLYYFIGGTGKISVAVCDEPAGQYEFYGYVHYSDGVPIGKKGEPFMFDPGIFMDDDGKLYLYVGFGLENNPILLGKEHPTLYGPMCFEIDPNDMLTVKAGPTYIGVAGPKNEVGSGYEGHSFLEASSMRKFDGMYYFIYSSMQSHELCYAYSDKPDKGFSYGGTLISNGDIGLPGVKDVKHARNDTGNTHGSLIKIKDKYYVFYHRHTNRKQSSSQACAEEIRFENGRFYQAEMTSCGLNNGPLNGQGIYSAGICCNLYGKRGSRFLSMIKRSAYGVPYLTQDGKDYHPETGNDKKAPTQYISNMCDGATAVFKYFMLEHTRRISVVIRGKASGILKVYEENSKIPLCELLIESNKKEVQTVKANFTVDGLIEIRSNLKEKGLTLKFVYSGKGKFDFICFKLEK